MIRVFIECDYPDCGAAGPTGPGPGGITARRLAEDAGFGQHITFGTLYWVCPAHAGWRMSRDNRPNRPLWREITGTEGQPARRGEEG